MTLFSFLGPVNSEPPRTEKDGRNEADCHRRGTANTGAQANGAGSAVDGTPRTAQGLGGLVRMTEVRRTGKKRGDVMVAAPGCSGLSGLRRTSITVAGRMSPRASLAIRRLSCLRGVVIGRLLYGQGRRAADALRDFHHSETEFPPSPRSPGPATGWRYGSLSDR